MKKIYFPASDAATLFEGADTIALETIDAEASAVRFDELLAERIEAAYPDADEVTADSGWMGTNYHVEGYGGPDEDEEVSEQVQALAGILFGDGAAWMVDAGPAPHHPYAIRFPRVVEVSTAHELFAWTETHPILAGAEWPMDGYQNTGDPNESAFILAVPTPAGLVGFFATEGADAGTIRAGVV